MKNLEEDKPDLKDHVEHLRTIHFALIGTCIALFITYQFLPGSEWNDALAKVKELTEGRLTKDLNNEKLKELERGVISEVIECDRDILKEILQDRNNNKCSVAGRPATMPRERYPLKDYWRVGNVETGYRQVAFEGDGIFCCLRFDFGASGRLETKIKLEPALKESFPPINTPPFPEKPTLNDYTLIWREFTSNTTIQIPWRLIITFDDSTSSNLPKGSNILPAQNANSIIRLSKTTPDSHSWDGVYETSELSPHISDNIHPIVKLKVTVTMKQVIVDPGLWVTRADKRYQEKHTNLLFIAEQRELMGSTFQEAREHIENQIKIRTESITILGLKIPSDLLLNWGVIIIVTLQLYLLMHLKFYCKLLSINHTYKVAWIGYYPDFLSKTIFFFSALIMPPVIVLIIVSEIVRDPYVKWGIASLILIPVSAGISYLTKEFIFEVWKRHEDIESKEIEEQEV
jgi:hypothetical protein